MANIYNSDKYPDGRLRMMKRGFFAVKPYGSYEVRDASADTLVPDKTAENFGKIEPFMLKFFNRRFYISSIEQTAERVTKKAYRDESTGEVVVKEEGETYEYLPVYSSLNFGSQCVARLYKVKDEEDLWIGTLAGYTCKLDLATVHEYTKKDQSVIQYYVAEMSKSW